MSETTTLVRAGHVLTMGPLGDIAGGAVAVSGERIAGVGPFAELRRNYPDAQIVGDDLVGMTRNKAFQHLALPLRKGDQPFPDLRLFRVLLRLFAVAIERDTHGFEQDFVIERLLKKLDRAFFHGIDRKRDVAVTRHDDDG